MTGKPRSSAARAKSVAARKATAAKATAAKAAAAKEAVAEEAAEEVEAIESVPTEPTEPTEVPAKETPARPTPAKATPAKATPARVTTARTGPAKAAKLTARQRAEQSRQARERAARRARRVRTAWWVIAAAPVIIVLLLVIMMSIPDSGGDGDSAPTALSPAAVAALTPDPSILDLVGRGEGVRPPDALEGQPALTDGEKPLVLYVGAEYCPFCASQRWPLVIALSRFGTFTGLTASHSASDDVFPDTSTVSFYGSTYTSQYLSFQGVELNTNERQGRSYAPLQELTPEQEAVMRVYNAPPYQEQAGSIPFVDFGNRFIQTGSAYGAELLADLTHDQIAAEITDNPTGPVAQAILGSANAFTAMICEMTGGEPGDVCTSQAATAYQQEVGGA